MIIPLVYQRIVLLVFCLLMASLMVLQAEENKRKSSITVGPDYQISAEDVLDITVWNHKDLSGKMTVTTDGFINYPLIGKVKAEGLTSAGLMGLLTDRLSNGYIKNPKVIVEVLKFNVLKVFVAGEAGSTGPVVINRDMTLIEVISLAGGLTGSADGEVIVIRSRDKDKNKQSFSMLGGKSKLEIRIDYKNVLRGDLTKNIKIFHGDYIFIPKAKSYYIMGQIKSTGKFNYEKGLTVRKAIVIAGGLTDKAHSKRLTVFRTVRGKETESKIHMNDIVQPDDVIMVHERLF